MKRGIRLPPMPPNMGISWYGIIYPIADIMRAVKLWEKGHRPTVDDEARHPVICRKIKELTKTKP